MTKLDFDGHFLIAFVSIRVLKKSFFSGCSKMPRCKAPEILRSEAYLDVRRNAEGPAGRQGKRRRWAFFSSLLGDRHMYYTGLFRCPTRLHDALYGLTCSQLGQAQIV